MNIANHSSTYACSPEYSFTGDRTLSARILVGINVCFCFIAIVGNVMTSMAVFSTRSLNLSYNHFLWSLTVGELILVLVCQPLLIALILAQLNSTCIPALQLTFRLTANLGLTASAGTVTLIALNTCLYVCGKFNYTNIITSRKKMAIVAVWVFAGVMCSMIFVPDTIFATLLWIVISFPCYATVLFQVHLHQNDRLQSCHQNPAEQKKKDQSKNETPIWQDTCGILMIFLLFSLRIFPTFFFNILKLGKRFGLLYYTAVTMTLIPSALYPIVYCLRYRNYLEALRRVCSRINPFAVKHDNEREETPKGDVGQELQSSIESTAV
ncbi:uncharacterized protein LOC122952791 [Acropora millepora]|uniref:uncharacterized protein LOC122952791 n=1 Tax=Acropora millepora TaxID=45264 RepID=UPI001CF25025|nr:uncharacterized protein LOC122952791 [Acropora millepora]